MTESSTIEYSGANVRVANISYYNLTLSGAGTAIIAATGTFAVRNDLTVNPGSTLNLESKQIGVLGDLQVSGELTSTDTATLKVEGHWSETGSVTLHTGSRVELRGSKSSVIEASGDGATFPNLTVSKTGSGRVNLKTATTQVQGELRIETGTLDLGGKTLTVETGTVSVDPNSTNDAVLTDGKGKGTLILHGTGTVQSPADNGEQTGAYARVGRLSVATSGVAMPTIAGELTVLRDVEIGTTDTLKLTGTLRFEGDGDDSNRFFNLVGSGAFSPEAGSTVVFAGAVGDRTIPGVASSIAYGGLKIAAATGTYQLTDTEDLSLSGSLTLEDDVSVAAGNVATFTGSTPAVMSLGGRVLAEIRVEKTNASVTVSGSATVATATITSGTLDIGSGQLTVTDTVDPKAGLLTGGSGTLILNDTTVSSGSGIFNPPNMIARNNVTILHGTTELSGWLKVESASLLELTGSAATLSASGTTTVNGTLRAKNITLLEADFEDDLTVNGSSIEVDNAAIDITVAGDATLSGDVRTGGGEFTLEDQGNLCVAETSTATLNTESGDIMVAGNVTVKTNGVIDTTAMLKARGYLLIESQPATVTASVIDIDGTVGNSGLLTISSSSTSQVGMAFTNMGTFNFDADVLELGASLFFLGGKLEFDEDTNTLRFAGNGVVGASGAELPAVEVDASGETVTFQNAATIKTNLTALNGELAISGTVNVDGKVILEV
ncbi:hypothetical protein ACFL59_16270, partial [Planctomycetota bacterium]